MQIRPLEAPLLVKPEDGGGGSTQEASGVLIHDLFRRTLPTEKSGLPETFGHSQLMSTI